MKNNNIIQEELNRAKQLWGYDTSKTIFEQATGSSCLAISQRTMCTGTTYQGGYLSTLCGSIDGQPLTQNDVGRVVRHPGTGSNDNLEFTIDQVQGLNQTQPSVDYISDVCPGPPPPPPNNACGTVESYTFCTGGTYNWLQNTCATINGQPVTQNDVGSTVNPPWTWASDMEFTIDSVGFLTNPSSNQLNNPIDLTPDSCPSPPPPPGPDYEDPCEQFSQWSQWDQRDFCEGCRRDMSEPGCECCTDMRR